MRCSLGVVHGLVYFGRLLSGAMLLAGLLSGAALVYWRLHGEQLLAVQSASMVPTFRAGDAVVVKRVSSPKLVPGQVWSYRNAQNIPVTHRYEGTDRTGKLLMQGDSLNAPDPAIAPEQLIGQAVAVVPHVGRIVNWLHSWLGLTLLVYIPAAVVVATQFSALRRATRRPSVYKAATGLAAPAK